MSEVPDARTLYLAMLADHRAFVRAVGGAVDPAEGCEVACFPGLPIELLNGVWIDPDAGDAAVPALPDHVARLEAAGAPPYVITAGEPSEAVRAASLRLGLTHVDLLPGMVVMREWLRDPPPTDAVFAREDDPADAARLLAEGFGSTLAQTQTLVNDALLALAGTDLYVARSDGEAVSTAATVHVGEGAGVYGVATPPAFRGRGYGAAVTAHVTREAFARGAAYVHLQASTMGHPVYLRLGFEDRLTFTVFGRPPPPDA